MGEKNKERLSALVVLLDKTTYEDAYDHRPTHCVIMVTEREAGDEKMRLPRIQLPKQITQAGSETISEYVRDELSKKMGFPISEQLTFIEKLTESSRDFFIFVGDVKFSSATDSTYASVKAKNFAEIQFSRDMISNFHYEIAKRFLKPLA